MLSTGNSTVDAIGNFNFEGNIIPVNWFSTFKLSNGKPDVNAIIILSEIVYWYRPSVIRDEETGLIKGIKKKFKADLLQRSYSSFSDQFGLTKIQVRDALDRLENFGVIKKHFRTITVNNTKLNNVLFIDLITPVLFKVTTLSSYKLGGYQVINAEAPHLELDTNTKNTTEITTEIRRSTAEMTQILKGKKPVEALITIGIEKDVAQRFNEHRKALKKPLTLEGVIKHYNESCNAGISTNDAARIVLSESWIGFANRYNWKPVYESLISESKSAQPEQQVETPQSGAWVDF